MVKWWEKYKKEPELLRHVAERMVEISDEIEDSYWKKEYEIYRQYTPKNWGVGLPAKQWGKISNLLYERNQLIHPLWVDISEIWETLTP